MKDRAALCLLTKTTDGIADCFHFCIGHCLIAWNAQFALVDAFGNGKAQGVPFPITHLLVWRNGIMNHCADTLLC